MANISKIPEPFCMKRNLPQNSHAVWTTVTLFSNKECQKWMSISKIDAHGQTAKGLSARPICGPKSNDRVQHLSFFFFLEISIKTCIPPTALY